MNTDNDTKTPMTSSGYTDSMSAKPYLNTTPLHKSIAHKLLDQVREGSMTPLVHIQAALKATGDL